jgi:hypothetical protein
VNGRDNLPGPGNSACRFTEPSGGNHMVDNGTIQKYHHLQTRKKQHRESHKAISVLSITRTGFVFCLMINSQTVVVFAIEVVNKNYTLNVVVCKESHCADP